jgi:hypothetical protein
MAKEEEISSLIYGKPAVSTEVAGPYTGNVPMPTAVMPATKPDLSAAARAISTNNPYNVGSEYKAILAGNAIPKEITPYEKEQIRLREREIAIQAANANRPSFSAIEGTPYAINSRTGEITTLKDPVTGQPLAPKLPQHLQNELTAINQQKSSINDVLQSVESSPQAFGPKFGAVGMLPFGDIAQNRKFTEDELKARSKVFNTASAVMKERAGTAMSENEKKIVQRFLPNEFDDSNAIIKKMLGFNEYLDAKAKGTIPTVGGIPSYIPKSNIPVAGQSTVGSPAAPAQTQSAPVNFNSEAEAARAGLPNGTKVIINGVSGTWTN